MWQSQAFLLSSFHVSVAPDLLDWGPSQCPLQFPFLPPSHPDPSPKKPELSVPQKAPTRLEPEGRRQWGGLSQPWKSGHSL